ncbi:MAG: glutathione S-transferase family protein [bacterium]
MSLTFYDYAPAPSPRKTRMILAEKNIPHERVQVDLMQGEQLRPDFLKLSSKATIPVLILEDGTPLTDNLGIACWAEDAYPEPALMGQGAKERGLVMSAVAQIDMDCGIAFMEAYRNSQPLMADRAIPGPVNYPQLPALAERGFARLQDFLQQLEKTLDQSDFIQLDQFTLADIWAFTFISVMPWIKAGPTDEKHPNIMAWIERIQSRPSAQI